MKPSHERRVRCLAMACSPRAGGNTDILIDRFVRGMKDTGAVVTLVHVRDMNVGSCTACGRCSETGRCVIRDDMDDLHDLIESSDRIVVATPVFFYQTSSLAAKIIERIQPFWAEKHLLDRPLPKQRDGVRRLGAWLAAGATRGAKLFDGMLLTARYYYSALNMELAETLTYKGIDEAGAIHNHPTALEDAITAGSDFADPDK